MFSCYHVFSKLCSSSEKYAKTRNYEATRIEGNRTKAFFIVFDHANACASMHSLVKIHNTPLYENKQNEREIIQWRLLS